MSSNNDYYTVISSKFYDKAIDKLFNDLTDDLFNNYDRKFGKFTVPIVDIKLANPENLNLSLLIHDYLFNIVSKFNGFELIVASEKFYLFLANTLYYNINWQIMNDTIEFSLIYGFNYEIDYERDCAYVYCVGEDDDDRYTLVGCHISDVDLTIEDNDFDY